MKKDTKYIRADIVNMSLDFIYKYIDTNISLEDDFYEKFRNIEPSIKVIPKKTCAYIRHKGYDAILLSKLWQRLLAFAYENDYKNNKQIGIYHDNTIIIPHEECNYIAALEVNENFKPINSISKFEVIESLCAVFHYEGKYGDVCRLMPYIIKIII